MNIKRIAALAGFLLVAAGIGFAIYWVFFAKKQAPPSGAPVSRAPSQTLPSAGPSGERTAPTGPTAGAPTSQGRTSEGPTLLPPSGRAPRIQTATAEIVSNPAPDRVGGAKFYSQSDGRFYRIGADGKLIPLSDTPFYNVQHVTWSPKTNESIIEYPDGANIYYNFDTKKQVTLPKHWQEFSFSVSGDAIAAKSIGLSPENRWLLTSNPNGSDVRLIEPLGENADKVIVDWSPTKQVVALSRTGDPLGGDRQEVLLIGQNGENFKSLAVEGRGMQSQWSPEGRRLLYSVYSARSDFKPELWVVNAEGDTIGAGRSYLNLNTWAEKCAFADERTLYCAVPRALSAGAGFSPALADDNTDAIVRVDLVTGARSDIPTDQAYTISGMFVGDNGKTLYFTDKQKPGLFKAAL